MKVKEYDEVISNLKSEYAIFEVTKDYTNSYGEVLALKGNLIIVDRSGGCSLNMIMDKNVSLPKSHLKFKKNVLLPSSQNLETIKQEFFKLEFNIPKFNKENSWTKRKKQEQQDMKKFIDKFKNLKSKEK